VVHAFGKTDPKVSVVVRRGKDRMKFLRDYHYLEAEERLQTEIKDVVAEAIIEGMSF